MQADTTTADNVTTAVPNPLSDSSSLKYSLTIFHQVKTPLVSDAWEAL
jgi:hypothetical protein